MQENFIRTNLSFGEDYKLSALFGKLDENIKLIEKTFNVKVIVSEKGIEILSLSESEKEEAIKTIEMMRRILKKKRYINSRDIKYIINEINSNPDKDVSDIFEKVILYTNSGRSIRVKTLGQNRYLESVSKNDVVFAIGPAGTGKTYLAVAMAVKAFKEKNIARIILTRPAVEAGESLGFLPGDMQMKVDPYLRPLYDAIFEMLGPETYQKLLEKNVIEVAPLAYMRGRTLDNAFIILDEAQNTTYEQMKMFLTRLGQGSKAIVTGDITQIDLSRGKTSGLVAVRKILKNLKGVDFVYLDKSDIVRHEVVQRIIEAYERAEKEELK